MLSCYLTLAQRLGNGQAPRKPLGLLLHILLVVHGPPSISRDGARIPSGLDVELNLVYPRGKQAAVGHRLAIAHAPAIRSGPPGRQAAPHSVALHPPPNLAHVVGDGDETAALVLLGGLEAQRLWCAERRLAAFAHVGVDVRVEAGSVLDWLEVGGAVLEIREVEVDAPDGRVGEGLVGDGVRVASGRAGRRKVGVVLDVGGEVGTVAAGDVGEDAPRGLGCCGVGGELGGAASGGQGGQFRKRRHRRRKAWSEKCDADVGIGEGFVG